LILDTIRVTCGLFLDTFDKDKHSVWCLFYLYNLRQCGIFSIMSNWFELMLCVNLLSECYISIFKPIPTIYWNICWYISKLKHWFVDKISMENLTGLPYQMARLFEYW